MSKQDGYSSRTPADLERKYNFGQTFAEVYGLVRDAQRAAEEAKEAYEGLDQEAIFNLLTNFGESQGVYRGDDGNLYINASYIKSGKLAADYIDATNLKVAAANITGTLVATQIDTKDLKVLAANITGTLTAGQIDTTNLKVSAANITGALTASQIDATNLKVSAANITGTLTAAQIDATGLKVSAANVTGTLTIGQLPGTVAQTSQIPTYTSQLTNNSGFVNESGVTTIVGGIVTADYVNALGIYASELVSYGDRYWQEVSISDGSIQFYSGGIYDDSVGSLSVSAQGTLNFFTGDVFRFYTSSGSYWELDGSGMYYYDRWGDYVNHFQFAN